VREAEIKKVVRERYAKLVGGGGSCCAQACSCCGGIDLADMRELPDFIKNSVDAYTGCLAGALMRDEYLDAIREAGFDEVEVVEETPFTIKYFASDPAAGVVAAANETAIEGVPETGNSVVSIKLRGRKAK